MLIFIVDNDGDTADFLLTLMHITEPGSIIDKFRGGEDCLKRLKEETPDLIITDCQMPGMSGPEMIRRIREIPEKSKILIVACSGNHELESRALEAGANMFFGKPFSNAAEAVINTAIELVNGTRS